MSHQILTLARLLQLLLYLRPTAFTIAAGTPSAAPSKQSVYYIDQFAELTYYTRGLTFDQSGNLYVLLENAELKKVTSSGTISSLSQYGSYATGLAFDNSYSNLYYTDESDNKVYKYNIATGAVSTWAGGGLIHN